MIRRFYVCTFVVTINYRLLSSSIFTVSHPTVDLHQENPNSLTS